jgi:hypothetical protein
MKLTLLNVFTRRRPHAVVALACAIVLAGACSAGAQSGESLAQTTLPPTSSSVSSAALEQCVTSVVQAERSATFTGEMTAVPGAARMAIRIDLEERLPGEAEFHTVVFPGLGVWRWADPKVKVYKYLKQVTNLSSPASYRGSVRFRWINAKGHAIKRAERLTARCLQPASPAHPPTTEATPPTATPSA